MRAILITVTILLMPLYGCDHGNLRDDREAAAARNAKAVKLYDSGEFVLAASEYLALADTYRADAEIYRLSAADAYIQGAEYELAEEVIDLLEPSLENDTDRIYRDLLNARLALAQNRPEQAGILLQQKLPADLPANLLTGWYTTQANFYERQNRQTDSILARIYLENYIHDPAELENNADRIWEHLNRIEINQLNRALPEAPANLRPWLELAALNRALMSGTPGAENSLMTWSANYPEHPANTLIIDRMLAAGKNQHTLPAHVALLLPLSGPYQNYSEKIRDGFLAAWLNDTSYKPVVKIYDTDVTNIREVYLTAVEDGADFIVGPLQKEAVKILAEQPVVVRTLALNQIDSTGTPQTEQAQSMNSPGMVQFGLPPEDEAREVALRAIQQGYSRVLIIAVADELGNRVVNAFSEEWTSLGGRVLERVNYDNRAEEFSEPVKQLLNINSSEARIALLRQRLGRGINVAGRLRNDADFIFMAAPNLTARQIVPHLRFFGADRIPVYSISSVYNGTPDPLSDVDLNNVEFVDMPWLLGSKSSIYLEVSRSNREAITDLPRYYAFGIDAYRLITRIGQLGMGNTNQYPGETGKLYMTGQGMVRRHPVWARFVDGFPQPIEPVIRAQ